MTSQEQQLLRELFERLSQTKGAAKDAQADAEIQQGLAAVPDAAYWLAQRTLLLENALQQAQQQIDQLQQALESSRQSAHASAAAASSFLSGGLSTHFGRGPEPEEPSMPAMQGAPAFAAPGVPASASAPVASGWRDRFFGGAAARSAPMAPAAYSAPAPSAPSASSAPSAAGSFLGTAAASAAGVAGGMLLMNGLGHMWGQNHGSESASGLASQTPSPETPSASVSPSTSHVSGEPHASAGMDQMAQDAGRDSIDQASSSDWDDGGSWDDDSFA